MTRQNITFLVAFLAGLASFLSPCVLPLVPGWLAYICGLSIESIKGTAPKQTKRILLSSLFFVFGFSFVFVILGASATFVGGFLAQHRATLEKIAGVIIIAFGLFILGVLKIPFLSRTKRFSLSKFPTGFLGSFILGVTFAFGWSPCVGPILSSILLVASRAETIYQGILLLSFYSFGLGLPFVLSGLLFNQFLSFSKRLKKHLGLINFLSGILLIGLGLILTLNKIGYLSGLLYRLIPKSLQFF